MKNTYAIICLVAIIAFAIILQNKKTSVKEFESETEALDALAFLSQMHAFPDADVENGKYFQAYKNYQTAFSVKNNNRDDADSWENFGPNNVGGRTVSIAIDPVDTNIVYLGSAGGGLWRSTSGGIGTDAWQYIPTGYPVLGVGAIAINPDNTDELFIGTGETYSYGTSTNGLVTRTERGSFGIGILKSTDGGLTWAPSLDWTYQENRGVWEIIYDKNNTDIIYAATTEGIYKTMDGGIIWENILNKKMVMDILVNPDDANIIYAGVGNLSSTDKGLYRSTDGGDTWEILTSGLPAFTNDGRITISAYEGNYNHLWAIIGNAFNTVGIYASTNAGDSWTLIDNSEIVSYQGWYAKALLIQPDNENNILAGGVELFKSENGGNTFTQITTYSGPDSYVHPDHHGMIANPLDPKKVYDINDGGLFRSNDFGETWYSCNDGYVTSQMYIGSISSQSNDHGLAGLQDNFTQRYNGTKYWIAVIGGDGCYNIINPADEYIQYGAYQYLGITRSDNLGVSFDYYLPVASSSAFLAPYIISPSNPDILYAGSNALQKTTDGGDSWYNVGAANVDGTNPILSIGISSTNPDTVYFSSAPSDANDMNLFLSEDGGLTKKDITQDLPNKYLRDIAVNKNNSKEAIVCFAGFGTGHIYRTIDAGENWMDISTDLPDVPFHTILFDPINDSIVYAGNDFTVFVTYNKGEEWEAYDTGLPDAVPVFDLQYSPTDSMLLAFTHGHGAYKAPIKKIEAPFVQVQELGNEFATVYPTLFSNEITINLNTNLHADLFIQIFDLQGNSILQKKIVNANKENKMDCSKLNAGNYIIKLSCEGNSYTKKIMKL